MCLMELLAEPVAENGGRAARESQFGVRTALQIRQ